MRPYQDGSSGSRAPGARTGFVNGGFAYGSLPFIFIFNYAFDTGNYHRVLDLIGCYVMIVVLSARVLLQGPAEELVALGHRPAH